MRFRSFSQTNLRTRLHVVFFFLNTPHSLTSFLLLPNEEKGLGGGLSPHLQSSMFTWSEEADKIKMTDSESNI